MALDAGGGRRLPGGGRHHHEFLTGHAMTSETTPQAHWLRHGRVVDGSGAPAFVADVLLAGGRIVAIGPGCGSAAAALAQAGKPLQEHDCTGLVVSPGFIDAHTHDDAIVLQQPGMVPKLSQGVTTVIAGNCGISLAPWVTASPPAPLNLLGKHSFRYADVASYQTAFEAAHPALNVALLIGHTTLRYAVMDRLDRPASALEIERMAALLGQCLEQGAIGLSSGLFYEAAAAAPAAEVLALAREVARHGGVYTTHLRTEMEHILQALREAGDTAFEAGVPLIISHHKCAGPANWGRTRETLPFIESLAQRQTVGMDAYPYTAGSTVLREDLCDGVIDVRITWSEPFPELGGQLLADIAQRWGIDQKEACRRLQPGGACYFQMHEDDVRRVLAHPLTMIGSDGLPHDQHPHPRLWGAFPRVLGHYCREEKLFTLEQAVHKMTGLSAQRFRLQQRGLLLQNWFADVVVFNPATVTDRATYDSPLLASAGIERVFVNGALSWVAGAPAAQAGAGRLLKRTKLLAASS
jgi:N-acyl-D-amino-acid deacylase